jgi:putative ABC transport system permease protein
VAILERLTASTGESPRFLLLRLATGQFSRSLHRNAVTIAAMVTSLAMVVGISTMIFSFRVTVQAWLERSVRADIFIGPAANIILGNRELVRPEALAAMQDQVRKWNVERGRPAEARDRNSVRLDKFRELRVQIEGKQVKMVTFDMAITREMDRLTFVEGDAPSAFSRAVDDGDLIISEALARKFRLSVGDSESTAITPRRQG